MNIPLVLNVYMNFLPAKKIMLISQAQILVSIHVFTELFTGYHMSRAFFFLSKNDFEKVCIGVLLFVRIIPFTLI